MILIVAKWTVILFGLFIIGVGFLMLFAPSRARATLLKAGSTNLINYAEITLRIIPAIALILSASISLYPEIFKVFGYFMLGTSLVLYFVPRKIHHAYAAHWAGILKPFYFRCLAPFSFLFGLAILYCII
jgi:hypothetical protein